MAVAAHLCLNINTVWMWCLQVTRSGKKPVCTLINRQEFRCTRQADSGVVVSLRTGAARSEGVRRVSWMMLLVLKRQRPRHIRFHQAQIVKPRAALVVVPQALSDFWPDIKQLAHPEPVTAAHVQKAYQHTAFHKPISGKPFPKAASAEFVISEGGCRAGHMVDSFLRFHLLRGGGPRQSQSCREHRDRRPQAPGFRRSSGRQKKTRAVALGALTLGPAGLRPRQCPLPHSELARWRGLAVINRGLSIINSPTYGRYCK